MQCYDNFSSVVLKMSPSTMKQLHKNMLTVLRACVFNYSTSLYWSEVVTLKNYVFSIFVNTVIIFPYLRLTLIICFVTLHILLCLSSTWYLLVLKDCLFKCCYLLCGNSTTWFKQRYCTSLQHKQENFLSQCGKLIHISKMLMFCWPWISVYS
jgi:hypothetical protein